jgi:hypothetical protein
MSNNILYRTSIGKCLRLFSLVVSAAAVLTSMLSCKPFDYPVSQLILDVEYAGAVAWSISVKPGDSLPDEIGDQSFTLDESDGPYVIIVQKNEVTADTLTATLTLRTVWISGETGAEMNTPPPELQQIDQQSTTDPNGSVIINY